jgi:hypothetical protein
MSETLGQMLDAVKGGLRMSADWGTARATSDGVSARFHLPDYPVIDVDDMVVMLEDDNGVLQVVSTADYTVDTETGWFTFDDPPSLKDDDAPRAIQWSWRFRIYSDDELIRLINSGVRFVGRGYEQEVEDDTMSTEDEVYEYEAPEGASRITRIEVRWSDDYPWFQTRDWKSRKTAGVPRAIFEINPGVLDMRMTYIAAPVPFSLTDRPADPGATPPVTELLVADQLLTDTGLPAQAYDAVVHYAVWLALEQRINFRARDDAAQHNKAESNVTMRDLESRSSRVKTIFDLHYAQFQTEFLHGRLIGGPA